MATIDDPEFTSAEQIQELLGQLVDRAGILNVSSTEDLVCSSRDASLLIEAADHSRAISEFAGSVVGNLTLETVVGDLTVSGRVEGDLLVSGSILKNLHISGPVAKDLQVSGPITGNLILGGSVGEDVRVTSRIGNSLIMKSKVGGDLVLTGPIGHDRSIDGTVGGNLRFDGTVGGTTTLSAIVDGHARVRGSIARDLLVDGSVGDYFVVFGDVGGHLRVEGPTRSNLELRGPVGGHVELKGTVGGDVAVSAAIGEYLAVSSSIGGDLEVASSAGGGLTVLRGCSVERNVRIRPTTNLIIKELGAVVQGQIHLGEHANIKTCDFREFSGFDKLRLAGSNPFETDARGRNKLGFGDTLQPTEQAAMYRQLRSALEKQGDRPTAADFYYHETEARRLALQPEGFKGWSILQLLLAVCELVKWASLSIWRILPKRTKASPSLSSGTGARWKVESLILTVYKKMSGYGTRASYALGWFFFVALVFSIAFAWRGIEFEDSSSVSLHLDPRKFSLRASLTVLLFTMQSMVSFFKPPDAGISTLGGFMQFCLRFTGPVLVAQMALAVRERVAR